MNAELYVKLNCINGEGPVWDQVRQRLSFIDVFGNCIYTCTEDGLRRVDVGENIGCAVPRELGGWAAGLLTGWYLVDAESGEKRLLCDPEPNPATRCNDGKADPFGNLWIGCMSRSLDSGYTSADYDGSAVVMHGIILASTHQERNEERFIRSKYILMAFSRSISSDSSPFTRSVGTMSIEAIENSSSSGSDEATAMKAAASRISSASLARQNARISSGEIMAPSSEAITEMISAAPGLSSSRLSPR